MVLISVDFPHPFGPRMATCSPAWMERVIPSRAIFSPRYTVTSWNSMSGCIQARARLQVKVVPGGEEVVGLAVLIDRHLACPDHFKIVALDDDGRTFVDANAKQLGMSGDHGNHIILALSLQQVLVHGDAPQKSESLSIAGGHHDGIARASAPNQIGADNSR